MHVEILRIYVIIIIESDECVHSGHAIKETSMDISFGQTILNIGIGLAGTGVLLLIGLNILFAVKRKQIKKALTDKYGF